MKLVVQIPCLNEAENIVPLLERLVASLPQPHETLLVYDFEKDTTLPVARRFQPHYPSLRLVRNQIGPGVLNAIKTGFAEARGDVVVVTMADLSDDIGQIETVTRMVRHGASVAAPARYVKGGRQVGGPLVKRSLSRMAGLSLHWLTGIGTHDPTNNFKGYRSTLLEEVEIESQRGFEIGPRGQSRNAMFKRGTTKTQRKKLAAQRYPHGTPEARRRHLSRGETLCPRCKRLGPVTDEERVYEERVHGTYATYIWHNKRGDPPCEACRAASSRYRAEREARLTDSERDAWEEFEEDERRSYMGRIAANTKRLSEFVENLLHFARIESEDLSYHMEPFSLAVLINQTVEEQSAQAVARIEVSVAENLPEVVADRQRTWQVVNNLLSNALKFSGDEGKVHIDVGPSSDMVTVSVIDDGPGIRPEDQRKLFKKFSQLDASYDSKPLGTGLGLYIAYSVVEAQGGRMWVNSRPGEGAAFCLTLPPAGQPSERLEQPA